MLLLNHFSRFWLCATPQMAAHQAPPSLGFSSQEHWSGLPLPAPMYKSEVAQLCPTLSDPVDCSLPGSSVHGIFQARILGTSNRCAHKLMSYPKPPPYHANRASYIFFFLSKDITIWPVTSLRSYQVKVLDDLLPLHSSTWENLCSWLHFHKTLCL